MTINKENQLKERYSTYQLRETRRLCNQIPKGSRERVALELQVNQYFNGNGNRKLLNLALKLLKEEPNGKQV